MSDTKSNPSIKEMFDKAEKSQSNNELNEYLASIKKALSNPKGLSPEMIQSAYEFVKLLKLRTGEKELEQAYTVAKTKIDLQHLKDEVAISGDIQKELKDIEWVKLDRDAFFGNPSDADYAKKTVHFGLKRINDESFTVEARNDDGLKIVKNISDLKEMNVFMDQIQSSNYDDLKRTSKIQNSSLEVARFKITGKTNNEQNGNAIETYENNFELYMKNDKYVLEMNGSGAFSDDTVSFDKNPSKSELDAAIKGMIEKYSAKLTDGKIELIKIEEPIIKKDGQNKPAKEIKISHETKTEAKKDFTKNNLIAQKLGINVSEFDDTNIESAITSMTNPSLRGGAYESWEKVGYKPDGLFGSFELSQLNNMKEKYKINPEFKAKVDAMAKEIAISKKAEPVKTTEKDAKKEDTITSKPATIEYKDEKYSEKEVKVMSEDEEKSLKKYLGVDLGKVNVKDALKILSENQNVGKEKKDWEKLGYKPTGLMFGWNLGIFGKGEIDQVNDLCSAMKDPSKKAAMLNLKSFYEEGKNSLDFEKENNLLSSLTASNVFKYISDKNSDGVTGGKEKGIITESQLLYNLNEFDAIDSPKTLKAVKKLISLGSGSADANFSSKEELVAALKKNPELKIALWRGVDFISGISDLSHFIKNGGENIGEYFDMADKAYENIGFKKGEVDKILSDNFDEAIKEKMKAKDPKLTPYYEYLQNNKKTFLERIKLETAGLFGSMIEGKEGAGAGVVIGYETKNYFLSRLKLDIGFMSHTSGSFLPGIGLHYADEFKKRKLGSVDFTVGSFLLIPFARAGVNINLNDKQLEDAGFTNFDKGLQQFGIHGHISTIGYGADISLTENYKDGIEEKITEFTEILEPIKTIKSISELDKIELKVKDKTAAKEELLKIKANIKTVLGMMDFDKQSESSKFGIINGIIDSYATNLRLKMIDNSSKEGIAGYRLSNITVGVFFAAGFMPLPYGGIGAQKLRAEFSENKNQDNIINLGIMTGSLGDKVGFSEKDVKNAGKNMEVELQKHIQISGMKIKFENGFFRLSGVNKQANIFISPDKSSQIKRDGDDLIIGNIEKIGVFKKWKGSSVDFYLVLGSDKLEGTKNLNEIDLTKNSPTEALKYEKTESSTEVKHSIEVVKKDKFYSKYLESNGTKFNHLLQSSKSKTWADYKSFRETLENASKTGDFNDARTKLVKFLFDGKKSLGNDTLSMIEQINGVKDKGELSFLLAEFKQVMELSLNVRNKSGKTDEEFNAIQKNLKDYIKKNKGNPAKKGDVDYAKKKLYDMNLTLTDFVDTDCFGVGARKDVFEKISNSYFGANSESIMSAREQTLNHFEGKKNWARTSMDNIFGLTASYKVAAKGKGYESGGRGFDTNPPGTVSVAGGITENINPKDRKGLIEEFSKRAGYFGNMKNSVAAMTGLNEKLTDENFKELLEKGTINVDGRKVDFAIDFVFYMDGIGFDESVGMMMRGITVTTKNEIQKITGLSFVSGNGTVSGKVETGTRNLSVGMIGGKKEEATGVTGPRTQLGGEEGAITDNVGTTANTTQTVIAGGTTTTTNTLGI